MYDYEVQTSDEGPWGRITIVPKWLRQLLGDDFFSDVHALSIGNANAAEPPDLWKPPIGTRGASEARCRSALALAAPLRQIRSLAIQDAVVRRDALEKLTCWDRLSDLRIDGCDVRDEDLAPLSRAVNVRNVHLHRQPISDAAVALLQPMHRLQTLGLGFTEVTDEGLAVLANFPELNELWLFQTDVSDAGMVHVGQCKKLQFLELSGTNVGDEGVSQLAGLTDLNYLNLSGTQVSDAGITHLAPLSHLEQGLFDGTSVTQSGVDQVPSLIKSRSYSIGQPAPSPVPQTRAVASP